MECIHLGENRTILNQFVAELRDIDIQKDRLRFRRNIERIGEIMAYEISQRLNYQTKSVQTPLGVAEMELPSDQVVLATVLRAGLPFHQGFLNYFDRAENAFVSASRRYTDVSHFVIDSKYLASPSIEGKTLLIVDPMLATGSSLEVAYKALLKRGTPAHVHVAAVVASPEGVEYAMKALPNDRTTLWVAALDKGLNEHTYIVPGLGDAGDLAFGEKE